MTTIIAAFALFALQTLQPPPNQAAAPAAGTATIRGHVYAADTGEPLRKAQVRIVANEIRENRIATTDEHGAYEFTDVRPARYVVFASKGSYVQVSYGQVRPTDAPKPLEVLDRQIVERLDLALPRGGVITGRVIDDFGEPMSDVTVSVLRYQFIQGRRTLVPAGRMASTNDLGEFRIFGVPPGQYYLSATWRNAMAPAAPNANSLLERLAYPTTFFPGTTDAASAQRLSVAAGREITDVVLVLRATKAARVSGTATGADGKPMSPAMVMVMRTAGMGMDMAGNAQVKPDGSFVVNALAPGEYTLRVSRAGAPGDGPETATASVTVSGEDLSDVHLVAAKPSTATGRVVVDPATAQQLPRTLSLAFFPAQFAGGFMPMPPPPPARVNDDYTFVVKAAPGAWRVTLGGFSLPPAGVYVKAVRVNGVDVTDSGVEVRANEDLSGIEVELTTNTTTVTGLVTSGVDPVKEYIVVVFPQDKQKWSGASRYVSTSRPDQDGRFKMVGLPPGDYYAVAVDHVEPGQWNDPEFLESVRPRASIFSLMEGETKTVDLKLTQQP